MPPYTKKVLIFKYAFDTCSSFYGWISRQVLLGLVTFRPALISPFGIVLTAELSATSALCIAGVCTY